MYDDKDTLTKHAKDWVKILKEMKFDPHGDVKLDQFEYRKRLIENLVKIYDSTG